MEQPTQIKGKLHPCGCSPVSLLHPLSPTQAPTSLLPSSHLCLYYYQSEIYEELEALAISWISVQLLAILSEQLGCFCLSGNLNCKLNSEMQQPRVCVSDFGEQRYRLATGGRAGWRPQ